MADFSRFKVVTFDCYGTLIDWEHGILSALKPLLERHNVILDANEILHLYGEFESHIQALEFIPYREVLRGVMAQFGRKFDIHLSTDEKDLLVREIGNWLPFPDTVAALERLREKFRLAVVSNIDNDLFARSAIHLKVPFDYVITSEDVRYYKPSLRNFSYALDAMGVAKPNVLHVAQSMYHDIIPAKSLGLSTVWVHRRKGKQGPGATPPAITEPDLEVPDLSTLVEVLINK